LFVAFAYRDFVLTNEYPVPFNQFYFINDDADHVLNLSKLSWISFVVTDTAFLGDERRINTYQSVYP